MLVACEPQTFRLCFPIMSGVRTRVADNPYSGLLLNMILTR
jgi:hypothetical protein